MNAIRGAGTRATVLCCVGAALIVGAAVLLAVGLRGTAYEGRASLVASPTQTAQGSSAPATNAQYGEVVSLTLPALVQLAHSPSVLGAAAAKVTGVPAPDDLAEHVSVELVPASGLARLSVRASSEVVAAELAVALARSMVDTDLLAPVGRLNLLDERAEVRKVAPDWLLATGLALAAAAAAGVAVAVLRQLLRPREPGGARGVREALAATGIRRRVPVLRGDDPALAARLTVLGEAAARPVRVLAVDPELAERAKALTKELGADLAPATMADAAVVALADGSRGRQDDLAAAVGVLPGDAVLTAVVLT